MKISLRKYAAALCESLQNEKDSKAVTAKIQNLLKMLTKSKQSKLIKHLPETFKTIWLKKHNKMEVTVVLATEPSAEELKNITQLLADTFKKEIILSTRVNSRVMGGMKIIFEDSIIDGTIAASLVQLNRSLVH